MIFPFDRLRRNWPSATNTAYTDHLLERGWICLNRYIVHKIKQETRPFIRELLWDQAVNVLLHGVKWFEPALGKDHTFETFLRCQTRRRWSVLLKVDKRRAERHSQEKLRPFTKLIADYRAAPTDSVVAADFYQEHIRFLCQPDRTVLELWLRGESFAVIGPLCGFSKQQAQKIQQRALQRLISRSEQLP